MSAAATAKLKKRAVEYEQKKALDKALELYIKLLDDAGKDLDDSDVPLYNRVGDLLIREGKVSDALGYYERAVDLYAERGYLNNAIALCNKILRQSPGRSTVYYKLGKISASKGFKSDARKNFLEYAERMQKSGAQEEAFRALKEFASLFPDQDDIRLILAEQLSKENRKGEALEQLHALYQKLEQEGRSAEARATIDRMKAIDPDAAPLESGPQSAGKPNDLIFLDLSEPGPSTSAPRAAEPAAAPKAPLRAAESNVPALEGLNLTFVPGTEQADPARAERIEGFEPTSAADPAPPAPTGEAPSREERTGEFDVVDEPVPVDFETQAGTSHAPPIEPLEVDAPPVINLDAPAADDALSGTEFAELELTDIGRPAPSRAHDLALPTALPMLQTAELQVPQRNKSANAKPDADASENASGSAFSGVEGLETVERGLDDLARTVGQDTPDKDSERTAGDEALGAVFGDVLTNAEDKSEPSADRGANTRRNDLLEAAPEFGGDADLGGHVFPPLPGLSEDSAEDETDAERVADEPEPVPNASDVRDVQSILAMPPQVESLVEGNGKVEAPLPHGFGEGADAADRPAGGGRAASPTPRPVVSLGGAEAQLRQRVELDPQNWKLRCQLGEALLDSGHRDEGLYELELAMVGLELSGDLSAAQEVADEIIRVAPTSVRHHQKRVEYAVRAKDRQRLIEAYLELADALFRTGQGDKSVAVYARVLELAPDNDRALFALSTLAPGHGASGHGHAAHLERWTDEVGAIPEGGSFTLPPKAGAPAADVHRADTRAPAPQDQLAADAARGKPSGDAPPPATAAPSDLTAVPPVHAPAGARENGADATPILDRARSITPVSGSDSDFVDLGEWLRLGEPEKSTRLVVEDAKPTGDEQADFEELLRRFKRGVAENMDAEDYEAHYDLGVAYKEMGLVDEAIAEFQKALRGGTQRVRSYEALGQCFVEKAQYPIAAALLQRAVETPGTDDQQLVGVLYLLGFANEQMGRPADALRYYQRVFAVDLEFRDIIKRVSAMEHLTK